MMKRISTLLLMAALAQTAATAQETNPYWIEFGNEPVLIQQNNNGARQTLKFVAYKDDMLVAELEGGVGEVSLPVSESMVQTLRLESSTMPEVNRMISSGNYTGALTLLRPYAYPLVKFHAVPESFTQLHIPIRSLIDTLIRADELNEAYDLLNRIKLDKVGLKYSESAIALMNAYLAKENFDAAAGMTQIIPVQGQYAVNIRPIVDAADSLRAAGKYEAVIPLYQQIEAVVPDDVKKNVQMWLAYSLVLADRVDEATPMIDALEEPDPNERLFSLYKLLQGSRAHSSEDYGKALDLLTRGFVRAQTSYVWVPEMLYLIGDCYARSDDNLAARNVWTEIVILYPESPWSQSAENSLALLPPVQAVE
ncbi:tetratricopeptide repeat protein [Coraliomargarita sp. SDUM461003]|uniref:Tetratricopeptide repeat protein n=1 Tax=Thalassobacterium maritimum TaxID=3041265 RepID=A0ABU1AVX4_9BACT|nr:tetratricopeptide repeat protein [Coraliomargarita sp. SDUM461003]MDQ8208283.1 tetratricopeptide repeat protein [Coraliomargarita sp. SDUM461003]